MRASILAILILGGIVLNIKAQFSYNEKGQAIPPKIKIAKILALIVY